MSVLNLPRLHFGGSALWNPDTPNNSPGVYDENTLQQNPSIPPSTFVQWLTTANTNPPVGQSGLNGSWNVYGDGSCWFNNVAISGVQFNYGQTPITNDPICSAALQIVGGTGPGSKCRMVDVAPYQSTTTQIFYKSLQLGDQNLGFLATGANRMFLRWSMLRNLAGSTALPIAGVAGVIFQTAAAASDIQWFGVDQSPALQALQTAANASPNQGISIEFAVYLCLYYQTATYNGVQLSTAQLLSEAYANGFTGGNPAQTMITGTLGVWGPNELASAPTQILLAPANAVSAETIPLPAARAVQEGTIAAPAATATAPQAFPLGPATANVDTEANNLAVSFVTTILETDTNLTKEYLGTLSLQLVDSNGNLLSTIADIPYSNSTNTGYDKPSYQQTSGILDFSISSEQATQIQDGTGTLQLIVPGQSSGNVVALAQTPYVAETDQRGTYLDQGETTTISVSVYQNGVPADGIELTVAQYTEFLADPSSPNYMSYIPVTQMSDAFVALNGDQFQLTVPVVNGVATFSIGYLQPGTAMLGFFPPGLPVETDDSFPGTTTTFFAVIRLLGEDNALLGIPDSEITWPMTYDEVLECYNLVYPRMSTIFDLSSESAVSSMAAQILVVTQYPQMFDWTLFMPVTREMSAGKRSILRRFCEKVLAGEIPSKPPSQPTVSAD